MSVSDGWDRIERVKSHFKSPIFNIMLLIIVGLFVFGATFAYVHFFVPPAYAGETFKIFDDGITYWKDGDYIHIMLDGEIIDCTMSNTWSYRGYLSPICVEIIMRSLP